MKVVLFCGGMGMRLRDYSEAIPKPMVPIGPRPILWHLMKYYAHFGHNDFILCLGWKGNVIKNYFLHYDECVSNDFVMGRGGHVKLLNRDIDDWTITFVDTGRNANVGERLRAVRRYLEDEDVFLANYSDGLTDLHLPSLLEYFYRHNTVATCLGVQPRQTFHLLQSDHAGVVRDVTPIATSNLWMNGGFFVFKNSIFEYMREREELVAEPFRRLISDRQLSAFHYRGFWGCMDTYKEKQLLDDMHHRGQPPWEVWRRPPALTTGHAEYGHGATVTRHSVLPSCPPVVRHAAESAAI